LPSLQQGRLFLRPAIKVSVVEVAVATHVTCLLRCHQRSCSNPSPPQRHSAIPVASLPRLAQHTFVPDAHGQALVIEVFEERNGVLARNLRQIIFCISPNSYWLRQYTLA